MGLNSAALFSLNGVTESKENPLIREIMALWKGSDDEWTTFVEQFLAPLSTNTIFSINQEIVLTRMLPPRPSAERCRQTEDPLPSSDQPIKNLNRL
ncbi:hypothetical protein AVEN_114478-1, partial [Araneus ventricosus]